MGHILELLQATQNRDMDWKKVRTPYSLWGKTAPLPHKSTGELLHQVEPAPSVMDKEAAHRSLAVTSPAPSISDAHTASCLLQVVT